MNTKRHFSLIFLISIALGLSACQQPLDPITDTNEGNGGGTIIEVTTGIEPCTGEDAGTLNCYLPDYPEDVDETIENLTSSYESCVVSVLNDLDNFDEANMNGCSVSSFEDIENTPACSQEEIEFATALCDDLAGDGLAGLPPSDPVAVPVNAKAIEVKLQSCLDTRTSFFQFKGLFMGTTKHHQGKYTARRDGGWFSGPKKVRLPAQVSNQAGCGSSRQGKVALTFTPHKSQDNYVYNEDTSFDTTPFSDNVPDTLIKTWKAPHLTSHQLPQELLQDVDVSEIVWMLKRFDTNNPYVWMGLTSYQGAFVHYLNGQVYGDTLVGINPIFDNDLPMDFTMVVFIKSAQ